jgi:recombination DNA repair RAD52 pathway protein
MKPLSFIFSVLSIFLVLVIADEVTLINEADHQNLKVTKSPAPQERIDAKSNFPKATKIPKFVNTKEPATTKIPKTTKAPQEYITKVPKDKTKSPSKEKTASPKTSPKATKAPKDITKSPKAAESPKYDVKLPKNTISPRDIETPTPTPKLVTKNPTYHSNPVPSTSTSNGDHTSITSISTAFMAVATTIFPWIL